MAEKAPSPIQTLTPLAKSKLVKSSSDLTSSTGSEPAPSAVKPLQATAPTEVSQVIVEAQQATVESQSLQQSVEPANVESANVESTEVAATAVVATAAPSPGEQEADSGGAALIYIIAAVVVVGVAIGVLFFARRNKAGADAGAEFNKDSVAPQPAVDQAQVPQPVPPPAASPAADTSPAAAPAAPIANGIPAAPKKPGIRSSGAEDDRKQPQTPLPNAPSRIKAPVKPKKRF